VFLGTGYEKCKEILLNQSTVWLCLYDLAIALRLPSNIRLVAKVHLKTFQFQF
jgi:hypothetical protein